MTKPRDSKSAVWAPMGIGLLLVAMISITSTARTQERASADGVSSESGQAAPEIVPGIARADVDTLDLQLD